jgi:nucleotide-binding universal stress UspA family protein
MSFRRIIVALGTPDAAAAMNTAVELACAMDAELHGLFVEDVELLSLAALPFAGEVGFPSAARRPLDVATMERGLRAQARRLERALAARLAGTPVKWTFEVVRGRIETEILATAGERDLAILAWSRGASGRARMRAPNLPAVTVPLLLVGEIVRAASVTVCRPRQHARSRSDRHAPHRGRGRWSCSSIDTRWTPGGKSRACSASARSARFRRSDLPRANSSGSSGRAPGWSSRSRARRRCATRCRACRSAAGGRNARSSQVAPVTPVRARSISTVASAAILRRGRRSRAALVVVA